MLFNFHQILLFNYTSTCTRSLKYNMSRSIFQDCPKPMAVTVNEQTYIYNDPDSFNVMEFGVK